MTATTYETQTAAVVAGTATIDAGGSITEAIVLDSKQNLILMVPEFTSGDYLRGDATLLTFQVQAFDGGEWVEAADADGNVLSVNVGPGELAPCPSEIAGAYAIKVRSGSATGPVIQTSAREIQFVASSPASNSSGSEVIVVPTQGALTDYSGTIASGGTAQTAVAANASRRYLLVQNVSLTEDLWLNFGVAAVASQPSILLRPGSSFESSPAFVSTQLVSVIAATTGHAFVVKEG